MYLGPRPDRYPIRATSRNVAVTEHLLDQAPSLFCARSGQGGEAGHDLLEMTLTPLHSNRTAWIAALLSGYSLLLQAVTIGLHVTDTRHAPLIYNVMSWISIPFTLWAFIECGCMDGTKGSNRFGPSPKKVGTEAEVF